MHEGDPLAPIPRGVADGFQTLGTPSATTATLPCAEHH